ncbi:MAG: alpha/beta fold hydrolase [Saprospiraceae bacterium]|jgi:pimeloyl-ACP methyl ester carboxylesterase
MLHHVTYRLDKSAPWVTFVHGAGGSSSIWFKQIRDFRKNFNVLLLDLRGHGKSKKALYEKLKRYTFQSVGDDIIEVLDHLNIKSSHFVGISLGTIIIRELADRYPDRIKSMVLGGAVMKLNFRGRFLMKLGDTLKSVLPYLLLYRILAFIIMPKKKHRESRNLFIREAKKLYQREFKRWFSLTSQVLPLLKILRSTDPGISTLYIMGSEDYMFLPSIRELAGIHKSSRLHVIPTCGHVVNVEHPLEFNREAVRFIRSHY